MELYVKVHIHLYINLNIILILTSYSLWNIMLTL